MMPQFDLTVNPQGCAVLHSDVYAFESLADRGRFIPRSQLECPETSIRMYILSDQASLVVIWLEVCLPS